MSVDIPYTHQNDKTATITLLKHIWIGAKTRLNYISLLFLFQMKSFIAPINDNFVKKGIRNIICRLNLVVIM